MSHIFDLDTAADLDTIGGKAQSLGETLFCASTARDEAVAFV
jgi:hypothetical protein